MWMEHEGPSSLPFTLIDTQQQQGWGWDRHSTPCPWSVNHLRLALVFVHQLSPMYFPWTLKSLSAPLVIGWDLGDYGYCCIFFFFRSHLWLPPPTFFIGGKSEWNVEYNFQSAEELHLNKIARISLTICFPMGWIISFLPVLVSCFLNDSCFPWREREQQAGVE